MKLIWLSHFIPYPPRGGSRQRSFNLIRQISMKYETHVIALNMQGEDPARSDEYAMELRKYCASAEIWEPPYRWRGIRWWAELGLSPLFKYPHGCRALWSPELARRWEAKLREHDGALIHFDSIDLALYLPPAEKHRRVLNHHNCESAMAERRAQKEPNPLKKPYLWNQAGKLRRLEETICHQVDVNLTVSELDKQTLLGRNPHAHCHVVENGTDTAYFHPSEAPTEHNSIVFAGGLSWYPNVSGLQFFVRDVWPILKQKSPGIRFFIAGRTPATVVRQMAESDPSITLIPDPEDIRPWIWKGAVFVCPIIDGGGTRLKILDALALGKALVSTTIGVEGLDVKPGIDVLVADSPENFSAEVVRLLFDDGLRQQLATRGHAIVENLYSWRVIGDHLEKAYACTMRQPREIGGASTCV